MPGRGDQPRPAQRAGHRRGAPTRSRSTFSTRPRPATCWRPASAPPASAAEPAAVDEIVDRCARLPLALAVVAARAAAQPHVPLADLAAELAEDRLEAFADTDPAADLRARLLVVVPHPERRGRRGCSGCSGCIPGPDIDAAAAASLAGVPPSRARPTPGRAGPAPTSSPSTGPGGSRFHDLLRAYAGELAHAHDPAHRRRAALHRVLDHYVHGAHAAARLMTPHRDPIELASAPARRRPRR